MIDKVDLDLMDEIMDVVSESAGWCHIQKNDPRIQEAETEIQEHINWIKNYVSRKDALQLEDLICDSEAAVAYAAMLYGLHVADVLRTLSASSLKLSQQVFNREQAAV